MRNCLISTSGQFLDPDFLRDAGIPAIREHYGQKLIKKMMMMIMMIMMMMMIFYTCLNGLSVPLAQNSDIWGQQIGEGGAILTSNELVLTFRGRYFADTFGKCLSTNATIDRQTDKHI